MGTMNRYLMTGLAALMMILLASGVSAHPPSDLNLTYNQTTGNLSAAITHEVPDPTAHFVMEVTILLDGEETIVEEYTSQPTGDVFTYEYPLNATAGTEVDVSAECNIFGSIKRSLTI